MKSKVISLALGLVALAAFVLPTSASAAVHGLRTGFTDHLAFEYAPTEADRLVALQHARAAGATFIRVEVDWSRTAPTKPPSLAVERDPSWAGYNWTRNDQFIKDIVASGMIPLVQVGEGPNWAEGPGRPAVSNAAPAGTWKPSARDFGAFSQAVARRYSGSYPDPGQIGAVLPRVKYWQGWNEPNISIFLSPQWIGKTPASPAIYRGLQNAFYKAVKSVSKTNFVISAGTSPFGDPPGGTRMAPALFDRTLFCLQGRTRLRRTHCKGAPVHFDALAHHPYPVGPPRRHAPNPDDVVLADMNRLKRPLAVALKDHTVAPAGHKQLWVTEFSWDTSPPDPHGIPQRLEATYMEGAFSELWSEGVNVAIWYLLRDEAPEPSFSTTLQSGIYFRGANVSQDTLKTSFTAFRFPFTAYQRKGVAQLWGLAPAAGPVTIEALRGGTTWSPVAHVTARSDRLFRGRLRVRAGAQLRAVQNGTVSLSWRVFSPH
jgi:hypothetical protein